MTEDNKYKVVLAPDNRTLWEKFKDNLEYMFPFRQLRDFRHYLKHCFILKMHLIETGLPKGSWYDTDTRMLYGLMSMLDDFINKEKCFETIVWDDDPEHIRVKNEILAINSWWLNYHNRKDEIEIALHKWHLSKFGPDEDCKHSNWLEKLNQPDTTGSKLWSEILHELENKLESEEEDMMIRMIKIRKFLWT